VLSRASQDLVFMPVRRARVGPPGGMSRLAGRSRGGFLAQPSLAVLARGGPLAGRIPDPVQLDAARLLRSASGRGQRQAVVAVIKQGGSGAASFRQRTRPRAARRTPDSSPGAVLG